MSNLFHIPLAPLNPRFTVLKPKALFLANNLIKIIQNTKWRNLYHRKKRLEYWLNRVNNDLQETDRNDVLKLVEHMQDREKSILWIIRCITALLTIRKQLGKSFREVTKDDIRIFFKVDR